MLIRLPSAEKYVEAVSKEQKWLPVLAPNLSFHIPKPLALGKPSKNYPWNWSIYKWIKGESANSFDASSLNLSLIASDLAKFLNELHKIDITDGPISGTHNFWRGGNLAVYNLETKSAIKNLKNLVDADKALSVWEKALNSQWNKKPVWIHGDFASGNIIIKNGKLDAVIDFGGIAVGDPAYDLVIIWTFLQNEARKVFKEKLALDDDTWDRARGWALWKALIAPLDGLYAVKNLQIIHDILYEHEKL